MNRFDPRAARESLAMAARSRWATALVAALMLVVVAIAPIAATEPTTYTPACNAVNIRTSPSLGATIKTRLDTGAKVTVAATVAGSAWSTTCPTPKSGSSWLRISAINGASVTTLYGVPALYAAAGVLNLVPTAAAAPPPPPPADSTTATTMSPACDGINIRASASTSSTIKARLGLSATVGVLGTVSGAYWSAVCPTAKSGSSWYKVVSINGQSVSSLYGVSVIYAATGILGLPANITPLGANVTFYGRGWGHGVGMSQWGAKGRAVAGQTTTQILTHYYAGTTIGTVTAGTPVRVLILDEAAPSATAPLTVWGRGGGWTVSGVGTVFPADARLRVVPVADGGLHLVIDAASGVLLDTPVPSDLRLSAASATTRFEVAGKPAAYDTYRGSLRVLATTATTFDVVNELPLESYLAGVVPAEMPSTWPAEALKAQAIAARSYAANHLHPASGVFDLYDDTRSQVYVGIGGETAAASAAIVATADQVLLSNGAIVNAMFHSTGGGATENNEFAFTSATGGIVAGPVSYLRGSADRDANGVPYDAGSPYATWQTKTYTLAALSSIFASDSRTNVGTLQGLGLSYRGVSGRLVAVTMVGSTGTKTVSGGVFVAAFNAARPSADPMMRDTLFALAPIP